MWNEQHKKRRDCFFFFNQMDLGFTNLLPYLITELPGRKKK